MWYLPSYGRPEALKRFASAPGGMPPNIIVIVNEDDPKREEYLRISPWPIEFIPAGSRFCDAWRWIEANQQDYAWYGMLADDMWPRTPYWYTLLPEAAEDRYIAYPNGNDVEFPLLRACCVLGGGIFRAIGQMAPPEFKHNYIDVMIDTLGRDAGILRALPDVWVDHHHWKFVSGVVRDATYIRGSADQDLDAHHYWQWMGGQDRRDKNERIRKFLAG